MARLASADILCVGSKSVREKFTGIIRYINFLLFIKYILDANFIFVWWLLLEQNANYSGTLEFHLCWPGLYEIECSLLFTFYFFQREHLETKAISFNRQQDVRATEIDKVDMHSSFRPGDIVKAVVVSLCSNYF